jgi:hypothetical protein
MCLTGNTGTTTGERIIVLPYPFSRDAEGWPQTEITATQGIFGINGILEPSDYAYFGVHGIYDPLIWWGQNALLNINDDLTFLSSHR